MQAQLTQALPLDLNPVLVPAGQDVAGHEELLEVPVGDLAARVEQGPGTVDGITEVDGHAWAEAEMTGGRVHRREVRAT